MRAALIQGASRGIGLAIARRLAQDSPEATLFVTGRDPRSSAGIEALRAEYGERIAPIALDLGDEETIERCAGSIAERSGSLDLVINVGGVLHDEALGMRPERRLAEIKPEHVMRAFAVNALGALLVAKHTAPLLPRRGRSVFASLSARVGSIGDNRLGGWYAYRASKAALNQFVRTLSIEIARRHPGAICVALHPGTVDTDLSKPFQRSVPPSGLFDVDRAARQLLAVIDGLDASQTGLFFDWAGAPIEW